MATPSRWTPDRQKILADMAASGFSVAAVAAFLRTSDNAISQRARRTGVRFQGRPPSDTWADADHEAALRRIWEEGLSAAETAKALNRLFTGFNFTRCSVISKADRIGLPKRGKQFQATACRSGRWGENHVARAKPQPRLRIVGTGVLEVHDSPPPRWTPDNAPTGRGKVTLLEAKAHHCRWPMGDPLDPGFTFCGETVRREGEPYCATHAARAYLPPKPGAARTGNELMRRLRRYA